MDNSILKAIPVRERRKLRTLAIRSFYKRGHSMDQIVEVSKKHPELFFGTSGLAKSTIFYAVRRREYPKRSGVK